MYVVKNGFSTHSRRFVPGDTVAGPDLAGPVPVQRWIDLDYINPVVEASKPMAEMPAPRPRKGESQLPPA